MNEIDSPKLKIYHMTPQIRKNHKSIQLQRITQRISLLKHQLKKHKDQTSLDQAHLKQMNALNENFQNRLIDELGKCQQLKQVDLKTQKTLLENNLRTEKQIQTLTSNLNPYNQDRLNSKADFNTQIPTKVPFSLIAYPDLSRREKKEKLEKNQIQRLSKRLVITSMKNTTPKQKNKSNYLKETFLTSIIFILFTLILHQILQIF